MIMSMKSLRTSEINLLELMGTQSHVSRCSSPSLRGSHIMVEIMKSDRSVGGPDRGGGGGGGGFESSNASHPLSSANPPNLPRPPIHPHPHNHSHPLQPQQHQQPQQQLPVHTHPPTSHNGGPSIGGGGHGPSGPAPPPPSQNGGHGNAAAALNHHNHLGMVSHGHTHSPMQRQFHPHNHGPAPAPPGQHGGPHGAGQPTANGVALASAAAPSPAVHRESNHRPFDNHQGGSNSHNGGINGVTVVNGGPPNLPTADTAEPDNEKWWWVCCLEFCFCLL